MKIYLSQLGIDHLPRRSFSFNILFLLRREALTNNRIQMAPKRKDDGDREYKDETPAKRTRQSAQKPPSQAKRGRPPRQAAPAQGVSKQPTHAQAKCKFSYNLLAMLGTILIFLSSQG